MNVHVDMDQTLQSEPRLRLLLAENLLRDTIALIERLEVLRITEACVTSCHVADLCYWLVVDLILSNKSHRIAKMCNS